MRIINQGIGWSQESKLLQYILKQLQRLSGILYNMSVSGGTDEKVKYDSADPSAGYLSEKVVAGTGITIAEGTGANENKVEISSNVLIVSQTEPVSPADGLLWYKPDLCETTTTTTAEVVETTTTTTQPI